MVNAKVIVDALDIAQSAVVVRVGTALCGAGYAAFRAVRWLTMGLKRTKSVKTIASPSHLFTTIMVYASHMGCTFRSYGSGDRTHMYLLDGKFFRVRREPGISIAGSLVAQKKDESPSAILMQVQGYDQFHIDGFIERAEKFKKRTNDDLARADLGMHVLVEDDYIRSTLAPSSFDTLFLPCCDEVIRTVSGFAENRGAYERTGTKWQKIIMLHGEPGCGKTSLIASIARRFNRTPMFIRLHTLRTLAALVACITDTEDTIEFKDSIVVLEEADTWAPLCQRRSLPSVVSVSSDTDSVSDADACSTATNATTSRCADATYVREKEAEARDNQLGILLNMFDGIQSYPGLMVVMTTNRIDVFDKALIRDGRTTCIEVGRLTSVEVNKTFRLYFGTDLPTDLMSLPMSITLAELSWIRDHIGDREGAVAEFRKRFQQPSDAAALM